jgi:hypothetical protein
MDFLLIIVVVYCVSSGFCDGLITGSEEFPTGCLLLIVCDLETTTMGRPRPELSCCATGKNLDYFLSSDGTSIFPTVQTSLGLHLVFLPTCVKAPLGLNVFI